MVCRKTISLDATQKEWPTLRKDSLWPAMRLSRYTSCDEEQISKSARGNFCLAPPTCNEYSMEKSAVLFLHQVCCHHSKTLPTTEDQYRPAAGRRLEYTDLQLPPGYTFDSSRQFLLSTVQVRREEYLGRCGVSSQVKGSPAAPGLALKYRRWGSNSLPVPLGEGETSCPTIRAPLTGRWRPSRVRPVSRYALAPGCYRCQQDADG